MERAEVHAGVVDAGESKADAAALFDKRIHGEVVTAKFKCETLDIVTHLKVES